MDQVFRFLGARAQAVQKRGSSDQAILLELRMTELGPVEQPRPREVRLALSLADTEALAQLLHMSLSRARGETGH